MKLSEIKSPVIALDALVPGVGLQVGGIAWITGNSDPEYYRCIIMSFHGHLGEQASFLPIDENGNAVDIYDPPYQLFQTEESAAREVLIRLSREIRRQNERLQDLHDRYETLSKIANRT